MRTTILFILLIPLLACQRQDAQPPATPPEPAAPEPAAAVETDIDAIRQQVDKLRNDWLAAAEKDDAATVATFYTDDAVVVGSESGAPAEGRQAIQEAFATDFPITSQTQVTPRDFHASGDLAYEYGEFTQQVSPPKAKPTNVTGHYVVVLRRQADGAWKLVKHLSVTEPAKAGG